jgi:hypothetical protein
MFLCGRDAYAKHAEAGSRVSTRPASRSQRDKKSPDSPPTPRNQPQNKYCLNRTFLQLRPESSHHSPTIVEKDACCVLMRGNGWEDVR